MNTTIIKQNRKKFIYVTDIFKRNTRILATYYSLYAENRAKKKALITLTAGDESVSTLKKYKAELFKKINSILRRKKYKNQSVKYFSNIELGKDGGRLTQFFNPHLHIQFFFDNIKPIEEALTYLEQKYKLSNCDITTPKKKDVNFDYVVKEYKRKNYHAGYELRKKQIYYKQALYSSSRKSIPNYVIKYIYRQFFINKITEWYNLQNYDRYEFILNQILENNIIITTKEDKPSSEYKVIKSMAIYINFTKLCKTTQ